MNATDISDPAREAMFFDRLITISATAMTVISVVALLVNLYLLNCSRYLRRPIGVNLRLCVTLTASDALCAVCYILTFTINIFFSHFSNCFSLLLEVFKLTTFTASVFTLLALALNHYVGIVYPLHRNAITPRTVKMTIAFAYIAPLTGYLAIFSIFPGGLRAPPAFDFFSSEGCAGNAIYQNPVFRVALVAPFIVFVGMLSFLYLHILIHMRNVSRDPLLKNNKNKRSNRKLLITLMLLAGSACLGWLPTSLMFVTPLIMPFEIPQRARLYLGILSQTLHVFKLIADAFIYASRLVEIRYAMWIFNRKVHNYITGMFKSREEENKHTPDMPPEFLRYLSETKENRSMRSKRVKNEFEASPRRRYGSERPKRVGSNGNNNMSRQSTLQAPAAFHQSVKHCKSVPSITTQTKKPSENNNICDANSNTEESRSQIVTNAYNLSQN